MGRWPKRLTCVVLICALDFGVMPAASFGQDGPVEALDTGVKESLRFAPERLFSAPGPRQDDWEPSVAADDSGYVSSPRPASTGRTRAGATARIPR